MLFKLDCFINSPISCHVNYCFLWAETHYNISLKICFMDCFVEPNTELSQQWHFKKDVVSSLSNNPDKKLPEMGWWRDQEHLCYLTRVGIRRRWISPQSSAFSSFSPPSPFQIPRGKAPSNMGQLQEMVSHDVFVFLLSLILVFVFVNFLDYVFQYNDDMQLSQAWTILQGFDELIKSKHPLLWEYQISGRFIGTGFYENIARIANAVQVTNPQMSKSKSKSLSLLSLQLL